MMNMNLPQLKDHCPFCKVGRKVMQGELSLQKISLMVQAGLALTVAILNILVFIKHLQALKKED